MSLVGFMLAAGGAVQAQNQTTDTSFQVRINIQGTCLVVSATDIDFGNQISVAGTHNQTGTIRVQCTKDLPFHLGLNGGTTTGDVNARAMVNATLVQIPYTLRRGAADGLIWGNAGTDRYEGVGLGMGAGYEIDLTVYARATLTGNEPAGLYQDTVTATLTY